MLDSDPIKHVTNITLGDPKIERIGFASGPPLVYIGGLWGSICYDGFDENAAEFFCRSLGWRYSQRFEAIDHKVVRYPGKSQQVPVLLTNVQCNENATTIDDCTSGPMGYSNCESGEDVKVYCV